MVKRSAFAVLLLLAADLASAQERAVTLPTNVLQMAAVRKQLNSGLTTTVIVTATARGTSDRGAARIEIRRDLWDEVWLATRIEFDGKIVSDRLPSAAALERWWRTPLRVIVTPATALDMRLDVLPFSAAEEKDARQWVAKSGGVGGGSGLVDALIGSTLAAQPITTVRWRVDVGR